MFEGVPSVERFIKAGRVEHISSLYALGETLLRRINVVVTIHHILGVVNLF